MPMRSSSLQFCWSLRRPCSVNGRTLSGEIVRWTELCAGSHLGIEHPRWGGWLDAGREPWTPLTLIGLT